jgi:hypothetical protein
MLPLRAKDLNEKGGLAMRQNAYTGILQLVILCIVSTFPLQSCDDNSCIQAPVPGITGGDYDPVFSADDGFVITYGMLDMRYNEITFPGTHNSGAFNMIAACDNQDLPPYNQLRSGIRYIEFDVNGALYICHGSCHSNYDLQGQLGVIKDYAAAHPNQVITVRIGDLCDFLGGSPESYHRINGRLEDSGLACYIYNWNPTKPKDHPGRCYIPDPWPTLREMIESRKNVMFFHHRDYGEHNIIDEGLSRGLSYSDAAKYWYYQANDLEGLCKLMRLWDPPRERQQDLPYRLFLAECEPDQGAWAGDRRFAAINNDGRKLYQLAKHQETDLLPDGRAVNFIIIDYFSASVVAGFELSRLPIDIVDACNRLNYERCGSNWKRSEAFWELYPYEFDNTKIEHITQVQSLSNEVEMAIEDVNNKLDLDGHERTGNIVATSYQPEPWDWKRIPEWAADDDFFTRWCAEGNNAGHAWGVDLGASREIDEIAIAWEYPNCRPGYSVYASNDDNRFADGISQAELSDDIGWTLVAEGTKVEGGTSLMWDQKQFKDTGTSKWRYVKVKVTDPGEFEWPTFYELRLYGPAN